MFRLSENTYWGSEDELVKLFIEKFNGQDILFGDNRIQGSFYEQIRIQEIGRISDLIVHCGDSRLVNIEFKLDDYACVISQAKDHKKWADYSYICVPANSLRIFPQRFFHELKDNGIGLIIGTSQTFVEITRAKHNTYKSGKVKEIRTKVLNKIKALNCVQYKLTDQSITF